MISKNLSLASRIIFGAGLAAFAFQASPVSAQTVPAPDHVVLVMEENHSYSEIIGQSSAPYINQLATQGALFTQSFAIEHPSQPNYLDLFSGENQGVTSDNKPANQFSTNNIGNQLITAGYTYVGYSEGLPSVGFQGATSGEYARKHNPGPNFSDLAPDLNQPFTAFPASTNYASLPTFSFIDPDLLDDMHDGTIQEGDTWLKTNLASYIAWANANNSLLIITWDEDDSSEANQIPTIFVGPMVKPGQYSEHITHYTVLRTIEAMYGLPGIANSASVNPITDCWQVQSAPSAPVLSAPVVGNVTLTLNWTAPAGAATYDLYKGTTSGSETLFKSGLTSPTYTDTAVTAGTKYYYYVVAVNSIGSSPESNEVSAIAQSQTQADFSLTANPTTLTITPGKSATSTITVGALNGFTGTVALTVAGTKTGVTKTISPTSVAGSGTATLTVKATKKATAGSVTLTITGKSGTLTHTATVVVTIS